MDSEMLRLQQRLQSTEDVLRNALEHNHHMDQLVEAMCIRPEKTQVLMRGEMLDHMGVCISIL